MRYYLLFFIILVFRGNLTAQSYTVNQRIYWLSKIWKDVSHNYCDPNRLLVINWDSCFVSSVSAVMNPMTDREYYKLLEKLIATIQDGHTHNWIIGNIGHPIKRLIICLLILSIMLTNSI